MQKTIFIVDDNDTNLTTAEDALRKKYKVVALTSAAKMFKYLEKRRPDLILLDIDMPEMTGFEAMKLLKANDATSQIPVIFLTGLTDAINEAYGIELGAVDFITKPFSEPVLLNRIQNHLDLDELIRNHTKQIIERSQQLVRLQNGIDITMENLVKNRNKNTGSHIERTATYMKILIDKMLERGIYIRNMQDWDEEYKKMMKHSKIDEYNDSNTVKHADDEAFLRNVKIIAAYHHEKWKGSGNSHSLKETEIPLAVRIMAVIDVYDALVSALPYKSAFSHEEAVDIIMKNAGTHFDPKIAEIFKEASPKIAAAREKFVQ